VRNIRIPDVFLVKDLTYNLLSVSKLEKKGFVITIKNGGPEIAGIANRKGNLYKMNMIMKEADDSRAYSAVKMNNSKLWHTRMGHVGNNQFRQSARTVDGMNVKTNSDVTEVCEICVKGKQTRVPQKQTKVNVRRPLERIHSNVSMKYQVQEENNNVNIEDNKTEEEETKRKGHILPRCTRKGS
jgi:hypothetical protein